VRGGFLRKRLSPRHSLLGARVRRWSVLLGLSAPGAMSVCPRLPHERGKGTKCFSKAAWHGMELPRCPVSFLQLLRFPIGVVPGEDAENTNAQGAKGPRKKFTALFASRNIWT